MAIAQFIQGRRVGEEQAPGEVERFQAVTAGAAQIDNHADGFWGEQCTHGGKCIGLIGMQAIEREQDNVLGPAGLLIEQRRGGGVVGCGHRRDEGGARVHGAEGGFKGGALDPLCVHRTVGIERPEQVRHRSRRGRDGQDQP